MHAVLFPVCIQKLTLFLRLVYFQVWKAASSSSLSAFREFRADRAAVLPQDHRKHSHGETVVWHVQKLKPSCSRQRSPGLERWYLTDICFVLLYTYQRFCRACYFCKKPLYYLFSSSCLLSICIIFRLCFVSEVIYGRISSVSISLFLCFLWQCISSLVIDGLYISAVINMTVSFMLSCLDEVKTAWKWFRLCFWVSHFTRDNVAFRLLLKTHDLNDQMCKERKNTVYQSNSASLCLL